MRRSKKTWNETFPCEIGAHVKNVALRFDEKRRIKKKAEGIYLDYEKKMGNQTRKLTTCAKTYTRTLQRVDHFAWRKSVKI